MEPDTTTIIAPAHTIEACYDQLLNRFLAWAQHQEPIRAVIQVGSRVRVDRPADRWADLDLMLYLSKTAPYLERRDWLEAIAPVWIALPSRTAGGDPELLVMFDGGLNVDFVFCHTDALDWLRDHAAEDPTFRRGARVLLDRDGRAAAAVPHTFASPHRTPPTAETFAQVCDAFWYVAVYLARQIRRGDLWLAHIRDANLKEPLLRMLEWHAGVRSGWHADTWHNGRFIAHWADPRALAQLAQVFGGYDAESAARSLRASIELFRWLARETADGACLPYPAAVDARCSALVADALDWRPRSLPCASASSHLHQR